MFSSTPVYQVGPDVVYGLRQPQVLPDASDQLYPVPQALAGQLWLISELCYGVPDLYWVISDVNGMTDPLTEAAFGVKLRIPSSTRLANLGILTNQ